MRTSGDETTAVTGSERNAKNRVVRRAVRRHLPPRRRAVALLLGIAALGCSDATGPHDPAELWVASIIPSNGVAGTAVSPNPEVQVWSAAGAPLAGVTVNFQTTAGGGNVSMTEVVSDQRGRVSTRWTLGELGTNQLTVSAPGVAPVVFSVTARRSCSDLSTISVGESVSETIAPTDCFWYEWHAADRYSLTTPAAQPLEMRLTSADPLYMTVLGPQQNFVAGGGEWIRLIAASTTRTISVFRLDSRELTPYTLAITPWDGSAEDCEVVWVEIGVTAPQSIKATDCQLERSYGDRFVVYAMQGARFNVRVRSTEFDTYLKIDSYDESSDATLSLVNDDIDPGTTDSELILTAPWDGFYYLSAGAKSAGGLGAYTIAVDWR